MSLPMDDRSFPDIGGRLTRALQARRKYLQSFLLTRLRAVKAALPPIPSLTCSSSYSSSASSLISLTFLPASPPTPNYPLLSALTALSLALPSASDLTEALSLLPAVSPQAAKPTNSGPSHYRLASARSLSSLSSLFDDPQLFAESLPSHLPQPAELPPSSSGHQHHHHGHHPQSSPSAALHPSPKNGMFQTRTYYRSISYFEPRVPTAPWSPPPKISRPKMPRPSPCYGYNGFRVELAHGGRSGYGESGGISDGFEDGPRPAAGEGVEERLHCVGGRRFRLGEDGRVIGMTRG